MRNVFELNARLGQRVDEFCLENPDTEFSVTMGESRITSGEHTINVFSNQKKLEVFETLFSCIDLSNGSVSRIEFNPQRSYLSLSQCKIAISDLMKRLHRAGFWLTEIAVEDNKINTLARLDDVIVKARLKVAVELNSIEANLLELKDELYLIDVVFQRESM